MVSKWVITYNLLINGYNDISGIHWGFNPLTNLLVTSWDMQELPMTSKHQSNAEVRENILDPDPTTHR